METLVNNDSVPHGTKLPLARKIEGNEASDRLASPGNDDLLARLDLCQQSRQTVPGLMNIHDWQDRAPRILIARFRTDSE